jgi:hypothetical protein
MKFGSLAKVGVAAKASSIDPLRTMWVLRKYQLRSSKIAKPRMDMARSGQMGQPAAIKMEYMNGIFMQIQKSPKKRVTLFHPVNQFHQTMGFHTGLWITLCKTLRKHNSKSLMGGVSP